MLRKLIMITFCFFKKSHLCNNSYNITIFLEYLRSEKINWNQNGKRISDTRILFRNQLENLILQTCSIRGKSFLIRTFQNYLEQGQREMKQICKMYIQTKQEQSKEAEQLEISRIRVLEKIIHRSQMKILLIT